MFNFVPNISVSLTHEIEKTERLRFQTEAWLRENKEVRFTQSLHLTSSSEKNKGGEFLHSVHVVPNNFGPHHFDGNLSSATPSQQTVFSVARQCYICSDPFCPNINILNNPNSSYSGYREKEDNNCAKFSTNDDGVTESSFDKTLQSSKTFKKRVENGNQFSSKVNKQLMFSEENVTDCRENTLKNEQDLKSDRAININSSGISVGHFGKGKNSDAKFVNSSCCPGKFHCHTFSDNVFKNGANKPGTMNRNTTNYGRQGSGTLPHDMQVSGDKSSHSSQTRLFTNSEKENHKNICLTFWKPQLSFNPYKFGEKLVEFHSLWPDEGSLRRTMSEVCHDTVLRRAVLDMGKIALRCGPVRLLKALIGLKLLNLDQVFEDGSGMLHLALIAQNKEAVQFICQAGMSPRLRDKFGHTADQVCFSSKLRKTLPQKYLISTSGQTNKYNKSLIQPSRHDIESIFNLAKSPKNFDELQKKLQTFDFDVNMKSDNRGDYLVHIATRGGLCQFPLLLTLMNIQGADLDRCNALGLTPLMIAAQNGDAVLCDVLLCIFGCNPNRPNPHNGRYALHYACDSQASEVLHCLLNRGADFNLEDFEGRRPDDISTCSPEMDDCCDILHARRQQRSEYLSGLIQQGEPFETEVRYTDLYVVDETGRTLIMVSAEFNRVDHLEVLLGVEGSPIDAQHQKTGQTALSIAARAGNMEAVRVLLSLDANPNILDLHGYLPLHYAVMNSHGDVLETMLEFFPKTYSGLDVALRLAVNSSIFNRLRMAMQKRKEEIVTPELYDCALTGDAERLYRVMEDGDTVNLKRGVSPLFLAVENGHLEVVRLLYEKGGDISRRHPTTSATVLHSASKMGHSNVVEYLLQICRHPTPPMFLLMAIKGKTKTKFSPYRDLNHSYYKELDINALDGDGKTPLQLAADKGYSTIVKLLLDHGATTALINNQGELIKCPQYDGVRIMIESYRDQHTFQVMKCLFDRKGLSNLKQIWLPRFDHNLRDKLGNTPLMVACRTGRMDSIRFLLESAVYSHTLPDEDIAEDSDTDSGLERTSNQATSHKKGDTGEESSCPDSQSSRYAMSVFLRPPKPNSFFGIRPRPGSVPPGVTLPNRDSQSWVYGQFEETIRPIESVTPHRSSEKVLASPLQSAVSLIPLEGDLDVSNHKYVMTKLMTDLEKPKGLQIYHDNKVCHICAVNTFDGNTSLHKAIEGADNPQLVQMFINQDPQVAHMQNRLGYSPLHVACKYGRKKTVQLLLNIPYIDVHCLTADGKQPEELCHSKSLRRLLVKARTEQSLQPTPYLRQSPSLSQTSSSHDGSATTIDLDKIGDQYKALKKSLGNV